jgi:hypothetical protein
VYAALDLSMAVLRQFLNTIRQLIYDLPFGFWQPA